MGALRKQSCLSLENCCLEFSDSLIGMVSCVSLMPFSKSIIYFYGSVIPTEIPQLPPTDYGNQGWI